jgi:hypothetical protein
MHPVVYHYVVLLDGGQYNNLKINKSILEY